MNNKAFILKTNSLVLLVLILGTASLPAQTKKKLSDWINVQAAGKKVNIDLKSQAVAESILKQFEKTNRSPVTNSPVVPVSNPISNSPLVGAPLSGHPAAPPAATSAPLQAEPASPVAATLEPIAQTVPAPPAGTSVYSASSATALEREPSKPMRQTVEGKPVIPKLTVTPLNMVQQAYDIAQREGGRDFTISANGTHYAYIKRLNISSWAVVIDGKTGPGFSQVDGLKIQSHGWDDDFYQIVFYAKDSQLNPLLVVQTRDGKAMTYNAALDGVSTGSNGSTSINWAVDRELSAASRQAVRHKNDGRETFYQVGDGTPVMGPFGNGGGQVLSFDQTYRHSAFCGLESRTVTMSSKAFSEPIKIGYPKLIIDGQRVAENLTPPPSINKGPRIELLKLFSNGEYFARITEKGAARTAGKYILNGRVVADGNISKPPVISPDLKRAAWIELPGQDKNTSEQIVLLDGRRIGVYSAQVQVEAMQFTGDSGSLLYVIVNSGLSQVILDGMELPLERQQIRQLTAGPNKGQYAYLSGKEIMINGNRIPSLINESNPFWFTPDGSHIVGFAFNPKPAPHPCMFVDSMWIDSIGNSANEVAALKRVIGQPQQVGPQKWSYVLNQSPFQRVDIELVE